MRTYIPSPSPNPRPSPDSGPGWGSGSRMLVGCAVLFIASIASACPTCSNAIKDDPAALAFHWSTLFMLAMPYLLASTVGGGLFYVYWNAARNAAAESDSTATASWSSKGPERGGGQ